jgi:copper chaperone CopZ
MMRMVASLPSRLAAAAAMVLIAGTARAERVEVYSLQGADCATCADKVRAELKKNKGVKKVEFDKHKVELTVRMEDGVPDSAIEKAVEKAGFRAVVGAGQGSYLAQEAWPAGADMVELNKDGAAVGPLEKLCVPGKFTVFDVYADWCGPCRDVDERLRKIVARRPDVAVRKLSVVDFDSPLALELGLDMLPYVVVFTPEGKKTEIRGAELGKIDKALKKK